MNLARLCSLKNNRIHCLFELSKILLEEYKSLQLDLRMRVTRWRSAAEGILEHSSKVCVEYLDIKHTF